ncbi:MAG: hypothetical protein OEY50_00770 [Nitrospinota bacterium]|nr:hypothetical protein [Nitrospinota bacterium]MDH5677256.1 hypothetical protein [Nitrospinota bacterium]MDH5756261.1 hypothetical protein [Nitrospinota bacterium]
MKTKQKKNTFDPKAFLVLKCPLCDTALERHKVTTGGTWIQVAIGVLLTPVLVGFYIIYRALKGRNEVYACPSCGRGSS